MIPGSDPQEAGSTRRKRSRRRSDDTGRKRAGAAYSYTFQSKIFDYSTSILAGSKPADDPAHAGKFPPARPPAVKNTYLSAVGSRQSAVGSRVSPVSIMSISGEQYCVASRFYNQRQGSIMSPRRKQYYVLCRNTSGRKQQGVLCHICT